MARTHLTLKFEAKDVQFKEFVAGDASPISDSLLGCLPLISSGFTRAELMEICFLIKTSILFEQMKRHKIFISFQLVHDDSETRSGSSRWEAAVVSRCVLVHSTTGNDFERRLGSSTRFANQTAFFSTRTSRVRDDDDERQEPRTLHWTFVVVFGLGFVLFVRIVVEGEG